MTGTPTTWMVAFWVMLGCACAPMTAPLYDTGPLTVPHGEGPASFTVLNYNAWHGLDTGEFWVTASQTAEQSQARLEFQVDLITAARPDLILLQEVNPLPNQAARYVQALAERGLAYDAIHQVDACGIRIRGNAALIPGLNNGLAILARRELHLRRLTGLKLSGEIGSCESVSGLQFEELRYALIGDITLPETGQHFLVTSTHLHSGIEAGAAFLTTLERAHRAGHLPQYPEFEWEVKQDRLRRIGELDLLVRSLRVFRRQGVYAGFAVGGDFNFESDFPEYEEAVHLHIEDAYMRAASHHAYYTADPGNNAWIGSGEEPGFPPQLDHIFKHLPKDLASKAHEVYRLETARPRRIDYLWVESFLPGYCVNQTLFGTETNTDGMPGSDHFGVLTTFTRGPEPCERARASQ